MRVEPQKEHQWLQQLVGEWTYQAESSDSSGASCVHPPGTETVRPLGDIWILAESQGEMPGGGPASMQITLGYDPDRGRFVGTWIGSMMTHLWVYDGWLDETGKILTLQAEGPSMTGDGKMATYRDIIEIKDPDHHILTGNVLQEDGTWHHFMTTHYRRKK